ncbi:unnamed protein product [Effrenium voratum]|uniref:Uncharacterized protein n=1 Tax=Effrenium voratum TaxID=2562239 RepID=A0AA36JKA7_9DINO|nr:unnamed protein product [Effrenium voratum]
MASPRRSDGTGTSSRDLLGTFEVKELGAFAIIFKNSFIDVLPLAEGASPEEAKIPFPLVRTKSMPILPRSKVDPDVAVSPKVDVDIVMDAPHDVGSIVAHQNRTGEVRVKSEKLHDTGGTGSVWNASLAGAGLELTLSIRTFLAQMRQLHQLLRSDDVPRGGSRLTQGCLEIGEAGLGVREATPERRTPGQVVRGAFRPKDHLSGGCITSDKQDHPLALQRKAGSGGPGTGSGGAVHLVAGPTGFVPAGPGYEAPEAAPDTRHRPSGYKPVWG